MLNAFETNNCAPFAVVGDNEILDRLDVEELVYERLESSEAVQAFLRDV